MLLLNDYMAGADKDMNLLPMEIVVLTLCSCSTPNPIEHANIIGLDSFTLASRYGMPAGYQLQGDYMHLTYGSDAAGCRLIVLVDQAQRVAGWASIGAACPIR